MSITLRSCCPICRDTLVEAGCARDSHKAGIARGNFLQVDRLVQLGVRFRLPLFDAAFDHGFANVTGQAEQEWLRVADDGGDFAILQHPFANFSNAAFPGKLANPGTKFGMDRRAPFVGFEALVHFGYGRPAPHGIFKRAALIE